MIVPFVGLKQHYLAYQSEFNEAVQSVLISGEYILGKVVSDFETALAKYLNCRFVITVANGTDAIMLSLKALNIGPGDEVIVPVNSFIATAGAVVSVGARPVFCDITEDFNIDVTKIESVITDKTRAIIPVHFTGRPADMNAISALAKKYNLEVIEDAAQAIGALYHNQQVGTIGKLGCFSLHPLKNLPVFGDGGFISTNDENLYRYLSKLRNHGLKDRDTCDFFGFNSRLDGVQAAIGMVGLHYLPVWTKKVIAIADRYRDALREVVIAPSDASNTKSVYHNFMVLTDKRDALMQYLLENSVETKIHYPIPLHLQPASKSLGYKVGDFPVAESVAKRMMSLPIYPELTDSQIESVINTVILFHKKQS